eukprot:Opistho-1_new@77156
MAAEVAPPLQRPLAADPPAQMPGGPITVEPVKADADASLVRNPAAEMVRDVLDKLYKALYENIGYDLRRTIADPESSNVAQRQAAFQSQQQLNTVPQEAAPTADDDPSKERPKDGPALSKSMRGKGNRALPSIEKGANNKSQMDLGKSVDASSPKMTGGVVKRPRPLGNKHPKGTRSHYGTAPMLYEAGSGSLNSSMNGGYRGKGIRSSFPPIGASMSVLTEAPTGVNVMRMGADGKPLAVLPPIKNAKSEMAVPQSEGSAAPIAPQPLPLDTSALVRMLLAGCDAHQAVNRGDKETGATPLHLAAARNDIRTIEVLLAHKAQVNSFDNLQKTPLYEAAMHGHTLSVLALLHAGANINIPNKYGNTPLHAAVRNGHTETACMLMLLGANRACKNNMGHTYIDRTNDPMIIASLRVQCDMDSINERIY